jgi:hypothetical protein
MIKVLILLILVISNEVPLSPESACLLIRESALLATYPVARAEVTWPLQSL